MGHYKQYVEPKLISLYNPSMTPTLTPRVSKDAKLGEKGQVVIPAEFREALKLKPGDALIVRLEGNSVRITTRHAIIEELHGAFAREDARDLVQELLDERRAEATKKWS
jgi:AbrB family looped-hinge helix DNA binding protein